MPFNDNLPPQGTNPYYAPLVAAWAALKVFVNGLETSLAAKLNSSTYTTGMASKADLVNGVIPNSQIPPLAIGQPFPVSTQAAMLALTAQRGDVAIRSDVSKTFILSTDSPGTLGDWLEMASGTGAGGVTSVAGKTGVVALVKSDVGLGQVDNTTDANKPVSTAQAVLNATFVSVIGSPSAGQAPVWDGAKWVPGGTGGGQAVTIFQTAGLYTFPASVPGGVRTVITARGTEQPIPANTVGGSFPSYLGIGLGQAIIDFELDDRFT